MMYFQRDAIPSTILLASDKPIIRSPPPHRFNQELTERASRRTHKLLSRAKPETSGTRHDVRASQYRWSTTSGQAAAEGALPTPKYSVPLTTLERHADPVRQRQKCLAQRDEPGIWQQFAREWDMIQARCPMEPRSKPGISL